MNAANIPDLCLLKIFDRVPFNNLFSSVSLVCRRWHRLVKPSVISRRRELVLVVDERDVVYRLIGQSFNSVSTLSIVYMTDSTTERFAEHLYLRPPIDLIISMSSRLVKLTLTTGLEVCSPTLFRYINHRMPKLRELRLAFNCAEIEPLPVLKQLTHFSLTHRTELDFDELNKCVFKYAREGCEQLAGFHLNLTFNTGEWLQICPEVAKKITEIENLFYSPLEMLPDDINYITVRQLTNLFTSLITVRLNADEDLSVVQILNCLRSLTQLKEFGLQFKEEHIGKNISSLDDLQLPTVELIIWDFTLDNHQQLFDWFDFLRLFPRLKQVWIYYREAVDCWLCEPLGYTIRDCAKAMCGVFTRGRNSQLHEVKIKAHDRDNEEILIVWKGKGRNSI